MFILLDLLICLIYALVLIWLGLEFGLVWKNSASVVVPRLLGQHSRMLLIYLGGPPDSMEFYSHARYKFMCCALDVMISLCMFSYFHPVLGRAILPVAVDGSP